MENYIQVKKYVSGEITMRNYIAWSKDEENLARSSSGGIFYELAKEVIERGGVVVGVLMPYLEAYYTIAYDLDTVKNMRGSKYLQAFLSPHVIDGIHDTINDPILFVGLPCTIKQAKRAFRNKNNIIYVELRCHGVIKKSIFEEHMKKHYPKAETISFRNKKNGWRNSTKLTVNGRLNPNSKLIKDYIQGKNLPTKCKKCQLNSCGDIILGDYWECPSRLENPKGTSKVVTVTAKGQRFFSILDNIVRKEHPENKIAIMGGMTVSNNGTLIMTQNFIDYMLQVNNDIGFTLLEYEKGDTGKDVMEKLLPRYITAKLDYGFHSAWDLLDGHKLLGYFKSIIWKGQTNLEKQIRDCKTVVYLGGDHFVGKAILRNRALWFMRMLFTFWDFRNIKRSGKKLYLVSQTMGQLPWYTNLFAKWAFAKADGIYCRDSFSMEEMQKLGLTNIHRCNDLAFLPLYNENDYKMLYHGEYTILVVSDLWRKYSGSKDEFTDKLAYIANAMNKITGLPVFLMSHSCNEHVDYRSGEKFLIKEIERKTKNSKIIIMSNNIPMIQRYLLGHSKLNVSLRMHASISSLQQGVPVIPIAYSAKFKAMYSDLCLDGLVVDSLNMIAVALKIEEIWENLEFMKPAIRHILKFLRVKELALKPIVDITKEIKND